MNSQILVTANNVYKLLTLFGTGSERSQKGS